MLTALLLCFSLFAEAQNSQVPDRVKFDKREEGLRYKKLRADTLRVVTWNVEHFVDGFNNPYIRHDREDRPDSSMRGRPELLVKAIRALDADVVVLEEFESQAYLQKLAKEQFPDMGYQYFAAHESPDWYMNVVVMSRVPLGVMYSYGNISTQVSDTKAGIRETHQNTNSRMWSVEVQPADTYRFVLTGLHLKAGRSLKDTLVREGQINFIKQQMQRFLKENKKTNLLIAGDLNSVPHSREIALLLKPEGRLRMKDPIRDPNVFSHPADKPSWRIDYILVNEQMEEELLKNSVQVMWPLDRSEMEKISDHLPLKADFILWK